MGPIMPFLRPENGDEKSSPFLSLGFGVLFLLRRVFEEGFGQRTPCFVLAVFLCGSGCAFLYGVY